jgi:cellulose synthase (UDP-forming)
VAGITAAGEESICDLVFETLTPGSYLALADIMYGDAGAMVRFQQRRRTHKDILSGTWQFIGWGLYGPIRALACLMTGTAQRPVEEDAPKAAAGARRRAADPDTQPAPRPAAAAPPAEGSPSWLQLMVETENAQDEAERGRRTSDRMVAAPSGLRS